MDLGYQPDSIENPSSLKVIGISDIEMELSWNMRDEETEFTIAYQEGDTPPANCQSGTLIDHEEIGNEKSYIVRNLKEDTRYSFRICAVHQDFDEIVSVGITSAKSTLKYCRSHHRKGSLALGKNGSGQSIKDPYNICTLKQLNEMRNDLSGFYKLRDDIDATVTSNWNEGEGWAPVGDNANPFVGRFDGSDRTISNLTINRDEDNQGIFGELNQAKIQNLIIKDITVVAPNSEKIGGLAGIIDNNSEISKIQISGSVTAFETVGFLAAEADDSNIKEITFSGRINSGSRNIGGLVGISTYTDITTCLGDIEISGTPVYASYTGGIAGRLYGGKVSDCRISVDLTTGGAVGGAIGSLRWSGDVEKVLVTGHINSTNGTSIGGVVGDLNGNMNQASFRGSIDSPTRSYIGGLVGWGSSSSISQSYAHALIEGNRGVSNIAGFFREGEISNSFSTGQISTNQSLAAGFIAWSLSSNVTDSWSSSNIISNHVTNGSTCGSAGGVVGEGNGATLSRVYFSGSILATDSLCIGGLAGYLISSTYRPDALIEDSFTTGSVSAIRTSFVRGISGVFSAESGQTVEVNSNSRWDSDLSGMPLCTRNFGPGTKIGCTAANEHSGDPTYWFDINNLPMSQWDYTSPAPVWRSQPETYPILSWQKEHRVFTTSKTVPTKTLEGGLEALDLFCQESADDANLNGTFKALISTEKAPAYQRLGIIGPVYDTNDSLVARSATEFWKGDLLNPIDKNELGETLTSSLTAWTSTKNLGEWNGDIQGDCLKWTDNTINESGGVGDISATDSTYLFSISQSCNSQHRLYCVEQFEPW